MFPQRHIFLNKARLGRGGGLGEGNPFARQRKGFPSPGNNKTSLYETLFLAYHVRACGM